jgi:CubicO group peptidase (beta-lactamase class C family)
MKATIATWVTTLTIIAALVIPGRAAAQQRQHAANVFDLTTDAQIDAYLREAGFHGYVYLERQGQVILSKGYGMADAEDKVPNTVRTRWPAFSENRFMVGLAIMRLQGQGKLAVDDKICLYLSGCPAAWQPLTIEELLTNTSEIGSYDPFSRAGGLAQTMAACKATPLVSTPGTAGPWSDCNTLLLGAILERVTGTTWEAAMQSLVFGPAGMTSSGRMTNALKPPQRGRLYQAGFPTPELNYDGFNLAYTTVADLVRLNHALLAGTLISRQSRDAMFTSRMLADPTDPTSPGLGYEVVIDPATASRSARVCVSCIDGGGEDDEGLHAGFAMTIFVSPEARSQAILIDNDTDYFNIDADNTFQHSIISTRLYRKTGGTTSTPSVGRAPVTQVASAAQLDAYLSAAHFSGYVLLERHGHIFLSKGYGMADKAAGVPNTLQSRWPAFGTNRFITAVAILRLQDAHKLSVRDKVCQHITGCPHTWQSLTIEELLLDTSGLGTFETDATPGGVPESLARCKALPLAAAPGTITPASRCNNLLLNTIIVTVTGQPWTVAMQQLIFGPAHMTNSGQLSNALLPPARVQAYNGGASVRLGNFDNYYVTYASVEDLDRLDRALLSGQLLSARGRAALFAPHVSGVAVLQRYGAGHARQLSGGYECYLRMGTRTTVMVADNPGDVGGFSLDNALSPEDGTIAIIARNDQSVGTDPTAVLFGVAAKLLWDK